MRDEVRVALEELQAARGDLRGVSVWEMSEGGSAGAKRAAHEFVDPFHTHFIQTDQPPRRDLGCLRGIHYLATQTSAAAAAWRLTRAS